jgi:predicted regulator of Ras-like GTPase activity (Roadblock/LC7/MglB family)
MHLLDRFEPGSEDGVLMAEALLRASRDERMAAAIGDVAGSWTAMLEPRIVTAQRRGVVRADLEPAALAYLLAAMLDGFLIQRMAAPAVDTQVVAGTITRLLTPPEEDVA